MKLDLRLIVPGSASGTILLAEGGLLPSAAIEGDQDEATVVAATAFLHEVFGLAVPVLETYPRWTGIADGDPIPTLVTTEAAPTAWEPPLGLASGRSRRPTTVSPVRSLLAPSSCWPSCERAPHLRRFGRAGRGPAGTRGRAAG